MVLERRSSSYQAIDDSKRLPEPQAATINHQQTRNHDHEKA
jgi:hypothetical protein